MSKITPVTLSPEELQLVVNKEWILTKLAIIEKVYQLFGILSTVMRQYVHQNKQGLALPANEVNPKIYRGENYRSLPYVMLDYPRYFAKNSTLAIRTLFWWGNDFSIHLHLSGEPLVSALPVLSACFSSLQNKGYWLCINEDPWQHHFETANYVPLNDLTSADFTSLLYGKTFFKIAKRISLLHWDTAPQFLELHFIEMISLLQINSRGDERDLSPGIPK
ncbi:MAG: hypothetical protein ABIS01_11330, partial [Ferruginibacter sp.]